MAHSGEFERALAVQVIMLAPMAPHFTSELWAGIQTAQNRIEKVKGEIDWSKPVLQQTWPVVDSSYLLPVECSVCIFIILFSDIQSTLIQTIWDEA